MYRVADRCRSTVASDKEDLPPSSKDLRLKNHSFGCNEVCIPFLHTDQLAVYESLSAMRLVVRRTDTDTGDATMDATDELEQQSPFTSNSDSSQSTARTVPILQAPVIQTSAPSPGDPMEVTPPSTAMMGPPSRTSPENEANGGHDHMGMGDQPSSGSLAGPNAAAAAQAGAQQPKVVQTAFIHKLYK